MLRYLKKKKKLAGTRLYQRRVPLKWKKIGWNSSLLETSSIEIRLGGAATPDEYISLLPQ
jgi:hypothetical protein